MKGQMNLFPEEYIKDSDCTKDTPVVHGKPDTPIYGMGARIKPRVPGRQDTEHFKSIYLDSLLPLEEYDLIAILLSGGKDSIACYYKLLELGVPKDRIEFWHHDIDGGHPIILTTNLTMEQMKNCEDIRYNRIYDRIFEMCYPVKVSGLSWRKREAASRYAATKQILEG